MLSGKEFVGLVPPKEQRSPSAFNNAPAGFHNMVRDQLTITTWLCLGAVAQGTLFLAIGRLALVPAVLYMAYKMLLTYAQCVGWAHNPQMDGLIKKKFAAQFPDEAGNYGNKPANSDLCVFLIGTRSNSPLGAFDQKFKEMGEYFDAMAKQLDERADDFGFLGMTKWLNGGDRTTSSEIMNICYFRNVEGLHKFSHDALHRSAWDWWNKGYSKMPHLSIWHETYSVPKGGWESIYINSHASGINSTTSSFVDRDTGKTMWASPIVDASKGLLRTSAGRMSRALDDVHAKMGIVDPY